MLDGMHKRPLALVKNADLLLVVRDIARHTLRDSGPCLEVRIVANPPFQPLPTAYVGRPLQSPAPAAPAAHEVCAHQNPRSRPPLHFSLSNPATRTAPGPPSPLLAAAPAIQIR